MDRGVTSPSLKLVNISDVLGGARSGRHVALSITVPGCSSSHACLKLFSSWDRGSSATGLRGSLRDAAHSSVL